MTSPKFKQMVIDQGLKELVFVTAHISCKQKNRLLGKCHVIQRTLIYTKLRQAKQEYPNGSLSSPLRKILLPGQR